MKFKNSEIFSPNLDFSSLRDEIYLHQISHNSVYSSFVRALKSDPGFPVFLPVEAFRDAKVYAAGLHQPELLFRSSGTTSMTRSVHHVAYKEVYQTSIFEGLKHFYPVEDFVVLAYAPGYIQNPESSLVYMLNELIKADVSGFSQFLPINEPINASLIERIENSEKRVLLFGAAFGLAELSEMNPVALPSGSIIMETGGMKTYRKEMSRDMLHNMLANGFAVELKNVHSEYGMTEILSQAYSLGDFWFRTPPWMRVDIVNPHNPLELCASGEEGLIAITDLANWASCPFLLTGDRGVKREDGQFMVLGRWSNYHLRGCNFLLENE